MTTQSDRWRRWEEVRGRGRGRFVWLYGVCGWGLSCGCFLAAFTAVDVLSRRPPEPWSLPLVPLLLGPVGGYLWGRWVWYFVDAKYVAARAADRTRREDRAALDDLAREVRELREKLGQ